MADKAKPKNNEKSVEEEVDRIMKKHDEHTKRELTEADRRDIQQDLRRYGGKS